MLFIYAADPASSGAISSTSSSLRLRPAPPSPAVGRGMRKTLHPAALLLSAQERFSAKLSTSVPSTLGNDDERPTNVQEAPAPPLLDAKEFD